MCDTCGCEHSNEHHHNSQHNNGKGKTVDINQSLLRANEDAAAHNREHFDSNGILTLNLMSSPGSGKTTLLEKTAQALRDEFNIGVLEGDIETDLDAERIKKQGVPAVQLTTGGACHLESSLIHRGLHELEHQFDGRKMNILFIENVGNLVCPSFFNLGEHIRVVLVSVPEGPDKPLKYPKAFKTSHLFIITKSDLLPHFDFDIAKVKRDALSLNPDLKIIVTSVKTGEGMGEWFSFLRDNVKGKS